MNRIHLKCRPLAGIVLDVPAVLAPLLSIGQKFRSHVSAGFASAVQDATEMGVRVEVEEGESVGKAMRRLKKLQRYQLGWKWDKRVYHFVPLTEIRRKKAWKKLVLSWRYCQRRT
jgi:ribosomal protein S21